MALSIENIDEQFITIGTRNYLLSIDIGGNPDSVDVTGHMEGFNYNWSARLQRLYIRADEVTRLIGGVSWLVSLVKGNERLDGEIKYNVVPPGMIFHDLPLIHLYPNVPIDFDILIENIPALLIPDARLLGLKSDLVEYGLNVQGEVPTDSVFASNKGNVEIIVPLETGNTFKREYPYMLESGSPPAMSMPTFMPKGNYGELVFSDVQHAFGYEWKIGAGEWFGTQQLVNPSDIEVTHGNLEVTLRFPNVPFVSSYEYQLISENHSRAWTRFEGVLENGFITVIIPNLEEGVEYDLQIRVASPWIGTPVSIKVFGGRLVYAVQFDSSPSTDSWLYIWHTGGLDRTTIIRVKRFLLPTNLRLNVKSISVSPDGDVYVINDGMSTAENAIFTFSADTIASTPDGGRLVADMRNPFPTAAYIGSGTNARVISYGLDFYDDELYVYLVGASADWRYFSALEKPTVDGADLVRLRGLNTRQLSGIHSTRGISVTPDTIWYSQSSSTVLYGADRDLFTATSQRINNIVNTQGFSVSLDLRTVYAVSTTFQVYNLNVENGRFERTKNLNLPSGLTRVGSLDVLK